MPHRNHRRERLFDHADTADAILVINGPPDASFFWATQLHEGGTFEGSAAILRPDATPLVVTSPLEEETARASENDVRIYEDREAFYDLLREELGGDTVGLNQDALTVNRYHKLDDEIPATAWTDASDALEQARLIKDDDEINRIREACTITDQILGRIHEIVQEASTEADLAADLVHAIRQTGATTSFEPIVATGPASAQPHYAPQDTPLQEGALLIDMGAKKGGYCSDITRTFSLGDPSQQLQAMHETVLEAQHAALDAIEPGKAATAIHEAAEDVIEATEFKGRFIHSTGHSLGVEVHDGPGLSPSSDVTLEEGMVFTVEPGIYLPDTGGVRIEEDIVVTPDGCERLTHADRTLQTLA